MFFLNWRHLQGVSRCFVVIVFFYLFAIKSLSKHNVEGVLSFSNHLMQIYAACCLLFFVVGKKDTLLGDAFEKKNMLTCVCVLFMGGKKKDTNKTAEKLAWTLKLSRVPNENRLPNIIFFRSCHY